MRSTEVEEPPTSMVWEGDEDWYIVEDMVLPEHWLWWEWDDENGSGGADG